MAYAWNITVCNSLYSRSWISGNIASSNIVYERVKADVSLPAIRTVSICSLTSCSLNFPEKNRRNNWSISTCGVLYDSSELSDMVFSAILSLFLLKYSSRFISRIYRRNHWKFVENIAWIEFTGHLLKSDQWLEIETINKKDYKENYLRLTFCWDYKQKSRNTHIWKKLPLILWIPFFQNSTLSIPLCVSQFSNQKGWHTTNDDIQVHLHYKDSVCCCPFYKISP